MNRKFEISTIGGLLLGILAIFGSFILEGGRMGGLVSIPPLIIVFGGTIAAAIIGVGLKNFLKIGVLVRFTVFPPTFAVKETISQLVRYSTIARKDGLLVLERELEKIPNVFMKKILRFTIDGADPVVLRNLAETEIANSEDRHFRGAELFEKMGGYSPTMGIIGTVMGLIATLAAAGGDPNQLIHSIAGAFIATLWGVFMANIVWLPIADKLKSIQAEERLFMELITEGVLAIQDGEIPSVIKAKLNSMLPSKEQDLG
jgi:chemotaxis protein MotA